MPKAPPSLKSSSNNVRPQPYADASSALRSEAFGGLTKVISGGQTGVDFIALQSAQRAGFVTGGMAPWQFQTEKGPNPELGLKFGLREMAETSLFAGYVARSKQNVDDSDGTVAFRLQASVGTDRTIAYAMVKRWRALTPGEQTALVAGSKPLDMTAIHRPLLVIGELSDESISIAANAIVSFVRTYRIRTLNIAGHRGSLPLMKTFAPLIRGVLYVAFAKLKSEN